VRVYNALLAVRNEEAEPLLDDLLGDLELNVGHCDESAATCNCAQERRRLGLTISLHVLRACHLKCVIDDRGCCSHVYCLAA